MATAVLSLVSQCRVKDSELRTRAGAHTLGAQILTNQRRPLPVSLLITC